MMKSILGDTSQRKRNYNYDTPLLVGIVALCLVYTTITLATYWKLSRLEGSVGAASTEQASTITTANHQNQVNKSQKDASIHKLQHMFPIHVGTDIEEITHPGLSEIADRSLVPKDLPLTMKVPKFFDDAFGHYYGTKTVRDYLGNYGETLITPEQAASIGSYTTVKVKNAQGVQEEQEMETIYCSIASYRDPECVNTVEDLYQRAKYPDRIRVAIIDQHVFGEDSEPLCSRPKLPCSQDPNQSLCKYRHLIDVYDMDARLAVGPVFARHLAHRHYRGEYYAMQLDSHVRFIQDWDDDIVGQWKSAKNEMAVLSTYLSDLIGSIDPVTFESKHLSRPIMCVSDYEGNGNYKHLRHGQQPEGPPGIHGQPTLHPFWAAGFSFARGHFVIQVPYDQYLPMVFQGEEISIGLRGFTYGYDYYAAERSVCFHMYAIRENEKIRKKVPLFWENSKFYSGVGVKAMKRLNTIIGMANFPQEEWPNGEIEKYGLGHARKAEKFFKTFGIHTDKQTVEHHLCRFVGKPMMKEFLPALRENRMGIDYDKITYEFVDPDPNEK